MRGLSMFPRGLCLPLFLTIAESFFQRDNTFHEQSGDVVSRFVSVHLDEV